MKPKGEDAWFSMQHVICILEEVRTTTHQITPRYKHQQSPFCLARQPCRRSRVNLLPLWCRFALAIVLLLSAALQQRYPAESMSRVQ